MCGSTVVTLLWIRDTAPLSTPCVDVDVDLYESEFEGVCGSYQRKMDPFLKKKTLPAKESAPNFAFNINDTHKEKLVLY